MKSAAAVLAGAARGWDSAAVTGAVKHFTLSWAGGYTETLTSISSVTGGPTSLDVT
jgi:hypothetical protein